jgi:nucleoside-diphosphate-sugar epimerase
MKYIVTGGAGFIGHNVVRQLEAQGHECFILDSITTYGFIPKEELSYLKRQRKSRIHSTIHHIDLTDLKGMKDFFLSFANGCSAVIHLASFPRQKVVNANPGLGAEVMGTGLVNLLELTRLHKIPKFVYISSSMVYGDFTDGVTEDAECNPIGQYGIMKLMGEYLVKDYHRRGCFDYTIIRPSAVYGELDIEDRVVSKFVLSALRGQTLKVNGANERLDFTHVDDTAKGISQAIQSKYAHNKTYNITFGNSRSLEEAANLVVSLVDGVHPSTIISPRDTNFPSRGTLSIQAARQDFGFSPTICIEEGFKRYIEWFKTSKYWQAKL